MAGVGDFRPSLLFVLDQLFSQQGARLLSLICADHDPLRIRRYGEPCIERSGDQLVIGYVPTPAEALWGPGAAQFNQRSGPRQGYSSV
jgi:hypothetical protein